MITGAVQLPLGSVIQPISSLDANRIMSKKLKKKNVFLVFPKFEGGVQASEGPRHSSSS
jgi:hypothetical protein